MHINKFYVIIEDHSVVPKATCIPKEQVKQENKQNISNKERKKEIKRLLLL